MNLADRSTEFLGLRRAIRLEWLTIAWNAAEVFITIGLGIAAGSLALVAFGLDSLVEIWASVAVIRHLRQDRAGSAQRPPAQALRRVAAAFALLAAFLLVAASARLATGAQPDDSPIGIVYLAVTVLVMLGLARAKAAVGRDLGDTPLSAEARMTFLDACLAASVLAALVLDATLGWWWSDPLAAMVVGGAAAIEARENFQLAGREQGS
ncbi:MAG: cation transporter [Acidimicrobiia bacterium]|nr:cation transporter [Acidimicrobiia bacterium]